MPEFVYFSPEGINPDQKAESQENFTANAEGRYLMLRVQNTAGSVTVHGATLYYEKATGASAKRIPRQ